MAKYLKSEVRFDFLGCLEAVVAKRAHTVVCSGPDGDETDDGIGAGPSDLFLASRHLNAGAQYTHASKEYQET